MELWKKLLLVGVFFLVTPLTLLASIISFTSLHKQSTKVLSEAEVFGSPQKGVQVYASLPDNYPQVSGEVQGKDAREELVKNYLSRYSSPLIDYSGFIVQTADKYGLDYRLITAIAQQESNLCKKIPEGSYNCWGWGIHSRGTLGFDSYKQGIEIVSKGIKEEYIEKGYTTPDKIMKKYTPLSPGSWARGVNKFMAQMR